MAKPRPEVRLIRRTREREPPWIPLRRVLRQILVDHQLAGMLSLVFLDDAAIAEVHAEHLGMEGPTDVLSFPLAGADDPEGPEAPLGEVLVSVETARREAARHGNTLRREAALYAIHGTLHLAGYDDLESKAKRRMRRAEARYLALWDKASEG